MDPIEEIKNVVNATTARAAATSEGAAIAYTSLLLMALFPVLLGSFRSVKFHKSKLSTKKSDSIDIERLTVKDAAMFPFLASGVLIVLYTVFKIFSKDLINMIITGYFYFLGVLVLCRLASPTIIKLISNRVVLVKYNLKFTEECMGRAALLINYNFTVYDAFSVIVCSVFGLWYLLQKHWIANNLFGLAFAINGVEMLLLNRVTTGLILLGGLFFYDIFWVFYTDVMITVAKSFEAPIKLIFPQDILEHGIYANHFAMLGLGDIVIPGIFIALLLRFDKSLNRKNNVYFISAFLAYIFGLMLTIVFMTWYKHAQPALLYLVPSCLIVPLTLALIRGDLSAMLKYEDYPLATVEVGGNVDPINGDEATQTAAASSAAAIGELTSSELANKKKSVSSAATGGVASSAVIEKKKK